MSFIWIKTGKKTYLVPSTNNQTESNAVIPTRNPQRFKMFSTKAASIVAACLLTATVRIGSLTSPDKEKTTREATCKTMKTAIKSNRLELPPRYLRRAGINGFSWGGGVHATLSSWKDKAPAVTHHQQTHTQWKKRKKNSKETDQKEQRRNEESYSFGPSWIF